MKLWPNLPPWMWLPVGVWEALGGALIFSGWQYTTYGLILILVFFGGVLFSTILSEDSEGNTIISGKSSLGSTGYMVPLPGLFYTGIFVRNGF